MMSHLQIVHMLARENTMGCAPSSGAQNRLLGKRQISDHNERPNLYGSRISEAAQRRCAPNQRAQAGATL